MEVNWSITTSDSTVDLQRNDVFVRSIDAWF